ncbi:MAG TPA: DUF6116 family protein [Vicinamibacteria bacterium]|nr:DUF6116 family protein [Vicinamibacteria bacterium]
MDATGREERIGLIRRYASRLSFPKLFVVFLVLFLADLFFLDPIPFLDEAILGTLAVMLGIWRDRRDEKKGRLSQSRSRAGGG